MASRDDPTATTGASAAAAAAGGALKRKTAGEAAGDGAPKRIAAGDAATAAAAGAPNKRKAAGEAPAAEAPAAEAPPPPKAQRLGLSPSILARMFALADSDSDGTVDREEFERMAHELAEGGGALARTFSAADADDSGAVDRAEFESALAGVTAAQAEWWLGLRSEGAVELVAADGGVLAVTALEVAQMGTISALVEAVPLGVRRSVAVPRTALADAVELLRSGADGPGETAAVALPSTRLFQAIVALDFLDAPLSSAVVIRAAAAVPAAVFAAAAAAGGGGGGGFGG
eukprot:SAG22_NODE_3539_length_1653_cov_3.970399_2_plen_287_part_01